MKRWPRAGRDEGSVGSFVGFDSHRVKGDLESFKVFIESRGTETGAWRGNDDENEEDLALGLARSPPGPRRLRLSCAGECLASLAEGAEPTWLTTRAGKALVRKPPTARTTV
jgi:hypothetical protein